MEWRIYALPGGIFPQGLSFCVFCGVALGHSSPTVTLERYVHSSMELKRSNMNKLMCFAG